MYYILNETDQIIAADDNLLKLCNTIDVSGLSAKLARGDTTFKTNDEDVTITTDNSEETYAISKTSLSSILGHMTLVALTDEKASKEDTSDEKLLAHVTNDTQDEEITFDISADESEDVLLDVDDKKEDLTAESDEEITLDISVDESDDVLLDISDTEEETATKSDETVHFDISTNEDNDDLFEISEAAEAHTTAPEESTGEADETFDLLESPKESTSPDAVEKEEDEIIIDVAKTSTLMGISDEDYTLFLNEYIDTALALEQDLQSDDTDTRNNAIMTLTDLSEIMHLPDISSIMESIHASSPEQQKGYIGHLYTTLSRLTTQSKKSEPAEMDLFGSTEEDVSAKQEIKVEKEPNPNSFGTIDLSDVKPKHFDFQLEEAANDLSLPVELIEEFVHDFIDQAHIETKKMLEAYEEGDLAKIQSIGHLLKGASSNLRINALSDTLYKIQFCENENGLDDLIKDYWAHFLSFEHQIDVISN